MSSHVVPGGAVAPEIHRRWERWRERRDAEFAKPHGWLSLTALHWLDEDPTAYDGLPGLWWADEAGIHHDPTPDTTTDRRPDAVFIDGEPVTNAGLVWDRTTDAPAVALGEQHLELMERGGFLAIRVRDPHAPALAAYTGVPFFDYDPEWRIIGRYRAYPQAEEQAIGSAAARVETSTRVVGEVDLDIDGTTQTLKVTGGDGTWLVSFRDATSGRESAGACRWVWLSTEPAADLVIDFNFAANPPCAFSDYGTCPLPPAGNTLTAAVRAGERNPRG